MCALSIKPEILAGMRELKAEEDFLRGRNLTVRWPGLKPDSPDAHILSRRKVVDYIKRLEAQVYDAQTR